MIEEIRSTRDIHNFVRSHLSLEASLRLLDEIIESDDWMKHLEIDMLIYEMACKKREKEVSKPPIPRYY